MNILEDFYCNRALNDNYKFSVSGIYHQIVPSESDHKVGVYCHACAMEILAYWNVKCSLKCLVY